MQKGVTNKKKLFIAFQNFFPGGRFFLKVSKQNPPFFFFSPKENLVSAARQKPETSSKFIVQLDDVRSLCFPLLYSVLFASLTFVVAKLQICIYFLRSVPLLNLETIYYGV